MKFIGIQDRKLRVWRVPSQDVACPVAVRSVLEMDSQRCETMNLNFVDFYRSVCLYVFILIRRHMSIHANA